MKPRRVRIHCAPSPPAARETLDQEFRKTLRNMVRHECAPYGTGPPRASASRRCWCRLWTRRGGGHGIYRRRSDWSSRRGRGRCSWRSERWLTAHCLKFVSSDQFGLASEQKINLERSKESQPLRWVVLALPPLLRACKSELHLSSP